MTVSPALRFAPSSNGRLHLGHAYSALLNAELAARMHGRFLIRIEDIDTARCTQQLTDACLQDLAWLGLTWEQPVRIQSQHFEDYSVALKRLHSRELIYPCFCSRSEVAALSSRQDPDGAPIYSGGCKHVSMQDVATRIAEGVPHCWRLDMEKALEQTAHIPLHYMRFNPNTDAIEQIEAQPQRWGDVILARKETPTSYHLSVVVDDDLQGITHIVRGQDLEAATCLHRLLQALLGLVTPLYHHHRLIKTVTGDKLSKGKHHETLADLRMRGISSVDIRTMLGFA